MTLRASSTQELLIYAGLPPGQASFHNMLKTLSTCPVSKELMAAMYVVKLYGNHGSHAKKSPEEQVLLHVLPASVHDTILVTTLLVLFMYQQSLLAFKSM